jgi:hypothetical protein
MLTPYQKREVLRLRGGGYDFKTIARIIGSTPKQAANVWFQLPREKRAALTKTPRANSQGESLRLAKRALQREITLAKEERATAPPYKVSPLLW